MSPKTTPIEPRARTQKPPPECPWAASLRDRRRQRGGSFETFSDIDFKNPGGARHAPNPSKRRSSILFAPRAQRAGPLVFRISRRGHDGRVPRMPATRSAVVPGCSIPGMWPAPATISKRAPGIERGRLANQRDRRRAVLVADEAQGRDRDRAGVGRADRRASARRRRRDSLAVACGPASCASRSVRRGRRARKSAVNQRSRTPSATASTPPASIAAIRASQLASSPIFAAVSERTRRRDRSGRCR